MNQRDNILRSIKIIRESNGYSQEKMAELMEISQSAYARFESGRSKTDLEILEVFANQFGKTIAELFFHPNKIPTNTDAELKAQLTIELKEDKKEQVLKLIFGDNNLEILNK